MDEPHETHVNHRSYTEENTGIGVDSFFVYTFPMKLVAKESFLCVSSPSVDDNKVIEDLALKGEDHPRVKLCDQGLKIECKGPPSSRVSRLRTQG